MSTTMSPNKTAPISSGLDEDVGLVDQLRRVADHRGLLANLARREIKTRHKNSVLGFAWNLLNPLLQMSIYTLVFTYFMPGGVPMFALKLLSGMAVFGLFTSGLTAGTTSVVGNSSLVTKIWFPREVLPLASVAATLVTFASRVTILAVALLIYRHPPAWSMMWLALLAVIVALILATGLALLLAAINVLYRDVQHFLDLALLALFWFTPVVWNYTFLAQEVINRFGPQWERLIMLNPLVSITTAFERVFYNPAALPPQDQATFELLLRPTSWYVTNLAMSLVVGLVFLYLGLRTFNRLEGSFAERL